MVLLSSLEALMQVKRVRVVNPSDGVVVVTPDADRPKSYLRFEAKGDPEGGDVLYVAREDTMTAAFIKAVQRGVLVADGIAEDEELAELLRPTRLALRAEEVPLVVQNVDFDETDSYKPKSTDVRVIIEPLARV